MGNRIGVCQGVDLGLREGRYGVCVPRPVDAERARMIQKVRAVVVVSGLEGFEKASNHRRRSSPG